MLPAHVRDSCEKIVFSSAANSGRTDWSPCLSTRERRATPWKENRKILLSTPIEKPPPLAIQWRGIHTYIVARVHLCRERFWPFLPRSIRKGVGEQTTVNPVRWTHWIQDRKICIYGGWIEEKIRKFRRRFSWFWIILHPHSLLGPWIDGTLQRDGKGPWIRYYYYMLEIPVYRRGTKDFVKLDGRMAARIWITAWRERKLCRGCRSLSTYVWKFFNISKIRVYL